MSVNLKHMKKEEKFEIGIDCIGVGCGALIVNDKNQTLLIKRTSNTRNDAGCWSKPGGGVEFGERIEDAIKRETKEELGVDVELTRFLGFTESPAKDGKQHWISFNYASKIVGGEPKNLEPEKHEEIRWFYLDKLPDKINDYTLEAINAYKKSG